MSTKTSKRNCDSDRLSEAGVTQSCTRVPAIQQPGSSKRLYALGCLCLQWHTLYTTRTLQARSCHKQTVARHRHRHRRTLDTGRYWRPKEPLVQVEVWIIPARYRHTLCSATAPVLRISVFRFSLRQALKTTSCNGSGSMFTSNTRSPADTISKPAMLVMLSSTRSPCRYGADGARKLTASTTEVHRNKEVNNTR